MMTVDVNMQVRYTTSGTTYDAEVRQVKNSKGDICDLMVYPTIGYVQNVPRSATGVTTANDTWSYGLGGGTY